MENLYFPIFLVILAGVVIWIFRRSGSERRRRNVRQVRSPAGRTLEAPSLRRDTDRKGPAVRRPAAHTPKADVWQTRRERAAKESFGQAASRRGVHQAAYLPPDAQTDHQGPGGYPVQDQNIPRSEHLGIDEYLTKREKERVEEKEAAAGEFSMTAVKYEPADGSGAKGKGEKQASSKP